MSIDNQTTYWNKVAYQKVFTHPINIGLLKKHINMHSKIIEFGCGYGRIVHKLLNAGFTNVQGFDTSKALIERGKHNELLSINHIATPSALPIQDNSVDCILLFAVLTCIPSNKGQRQIISLLRKKLKPGGKLYISDYYLQPNSLEVNRYQYLNEDRDNYGVFTLPEGAIFRHHTKEWIKDLTKNFSLLVETPVTVKTMNGHRAEAFQLILQK